MKIGEGRFREVYSGNGENIYCEKRLKPYIKKYGLKIPTRLYILFKFRINNFNKYEYMWFQKISKIIDRKNLAIIILDENGNIRQELIKDYNQEVSKNLFKYENKDKLTDKFWEELEKIVNKLVENKIYMFDINHNVLVQEYEEGKYRPVLFDFKRIGLRTYLFQPWLVIPKLAKNKVKRRLDRVKK